MSEWGFVRKCLQPGRHGDILIDWLSWGTQNERLCGSRVRALIQAGDVRVSEHGYDELAADGLTVSEVVNGVADAAVFEEYPAYPKGPCALPLQKDRLGGLIHVVWGIPKGYGKPAVLITAYRPDPEQWDETYMRRRR